MAVRKAASAGGSFILAIWGRIDGSYRSPRAVRSGSSPEDRVSASSEGMPSVYAGARRPWRARHWPRANRALQQSRSWVRRAAWTAMLLYSSSRHSTRWRAALQKPASEGGWRPHAQRRPERSMIAPATLVQHWALKSPAQIGTMDLAKRFKGTQEKGWRVSSGLWRSAVRRYVARRRRPYQ